MRDPRNLVELGELSTRRFATRPLFGERDGERWQWITYAQWQQRVDELRAGLATLDVRPGDRVAIVSRNSTMWATAAYASYGLGAAFVPMYEAQQASEWEHILRDCAASIVLARTPEILATIDAMRDRLPALRHALAIEGPASDARTVAALLAHAPVPVPSYKAEPDEIAGLVYTSGTTGLPKGAMLSHGNLTSNVLATLASFPLEPTDRTLSFLPWAHVYGQVCELHLLVAAGGSTAFNTHVGRLPADLKAVRPTILVAVPRIFNQMYEKIVGQIEHKPGVIRRVFWTGLDASLRQRRGERVGWRARLSLWLARVLFRAIRRKFGGRLKYAASASATLSTQVAELIDGIGIDVYEGYGLTETSPVVTMNRPGHRKLGSVGQTIPGVRVVIDESRGDRPGEGEIVIYGPNVMKGYHARPEENARTFTADGGLRTGDVGRVDADGYLFITGRIKEQYKLENGKYVMPAPLEERLQLSPYIANVMLHGAGHAYNVAVVALDEPAIREWLGARAASIADLTTDPQVRLLIAGELARHGSELRAYERPRDFVLTTEPFTVDNGLLTPTLKVKRREVLARWGAQLEALYTPLAPGRAESALAGVPGSAGLPGAPGTSPPPTVR